MMLRGSALAWTVSLLGAAALAWLTPIGCSATSDTDGLGGNGSGNNGTGNTANGGNIGFDGGDDDADSEACAAEIFPGELVPLDLYIMLDQSGSMGDSGKWSSVTTAIDHFMDPTPTNVGMGVGIQYFPLEEFDPINVACNGADPNDPICGLYGPCLTGFNQCGGSFCITDPLLFSQCDSCDPADYNQAEIGITELPAAEALIETSMNAHDPVGDSTPWQPAMEGAVVYATAWAAANPTHLTYIVLATDGEPNNCTHNSSQGTADAAAAAAAANPPVNTFVIGVGDQIGELNSVAMAGGTGTAFFVDAGDADQFEDTLNEIRAAGACKFLIPVPEVGTPDYDRVNVTFVAENDPNNTKVIYYVGSEVGCHVTEGGWYYDDPNNPRMIVLCPASCEEIRTSDWDVSVSLGCETVTR